MTRPATYQAQAITRVKALVVQLENAYKANADHPARLVESVNQALKPISDFLVTLTKPGGSRIADFKMPKGSWDSFVKTWDSGKGDAKKAFVFLEQTAKMIGNVKP